MSERPGANKLTHFQWWLCFWLAMLAFNMPGKARINVYVDGKQVEQHKGSDVSCGTIALK
jgi:hypothetical protein